MQNLRIKLEKHAFVMFFAIFLDFFFGLRYYLEKGYILGFLQPKFSTKGDWI